MSEGVFLMYPWRDTSTSTYSSTILFSEYWVLKLLSHVRLCDPMDCSLPVSSLHGILQARVLEWVAISFSRGSSWPRDQIQVSHIPGRCFNLWATREAHRLFSASQVLLSFLSWCFACTSMSEGVFLMYPWRDTSTSTYSSTSCSLNIEF